MNKPIEFSKHSWHYKMNWDFRKDLPPKNLCPYIRYTIFTITYLALLVSVCLFEGVAIGQFLQSAFIVQEEVSSSWFLFQVCGMYGFIFGIIFGITGVMSLVAKSSHTNIEAKVADVKEWVGEIVERADGWYKEKEPSLLVEWLKARHDQLCPAIKFIDPNNPPPPTKGDTYKDIDSGKPYTFDGTEWVHDEVADPFHDFEQKVEEDMKILGIDK